MAAENNHKIFKFLVIALLLVNTFFLGTMWCAMNCGKKSFCPLKGDSQKMCPLAPKGSDIGAQGYHTAQ